MNLPEFLVDHPDGEIRLSGHRISLSLIPQPASCLMLGHSLDRDG